MAIMDGNKHLQPDYNAPRRVPQGPSEEELRQWHEQDIAARRAQLEKQRQAQFALPPYQYMLSDRGGVGAGGSFGGPYMMGNTVVYPEEMYQGMTPEEAQQERLYNYYMAMQAR